MGLLTSRDCEPGYSPWEDIEPPTREQISEDAVVAQIKASAGPDWEVLKAYNALTWERCDGYEWGMSLRYDALIRNCARNVGTAERAREIVDTTPLGRAHAANEAIRIAWEADFNVRFATAKVARDVVINAWRARR